MPNTTEKTINNAFGLKTTERTFIESSAIGIAGILILLCGALFYCILKLCKYKRKNTQITPNEYYARLIRQQETEQINEIDSYINSAKDKQIAKIINEQSLIDNKHKIVKKVNEDSSFDTLGEYETIKLRENIIETIGHSAEALTKQYEEIKLHEDPMQLTKCSAEVLAEQEESIAI